MQKKVIEKKSTLKYQIIKEDLMRKIEDGVYSNTKCLPSERELCEEYNLSRMTVRKAIYEMEIEGYLYKVKGKGTFVKEDKKIAQPLSRLTSFTEDMVARGMRPGALTLLVERVPANEMVADKLRIPLGDDVIMLRRLRLADDEPMAIETSYLVYDTFFSIIDKVETDVSLYKLMKKELHIFPKRAVESIEVSPLLGWESKLLGNEMLKTALFRQRQTFDQNNLPIEYVESKYRSDKYKFFIELYTTS